MCQKDLCDIQEVFHIVINFYFRDSWGALYSVLHREESHAVY